MKYPELSDVLPVGVYRIKLFPQDRWDNEQKKFIKGEQRTGVTKNGKDYFFYNTPDFTHKSPDGQKDYRYSLLAFGQEQKDIFDKGEVEAKVVETDNWLTGDDGELVLVDGKGVRKKKVYINAISDKTPDKLSKMEDFDTVTVEEAKEAFGGEEISIEDVPF